jgi:hypothetical protein
MAMTRTRYVALAVVAFALLVFGCQNEPAGVADEVGVSLDKGGKFAGCTTIPSGELLTSTTDVIVPGYDEFGYNYQAYMFNGRYCDYDRVAGGDYCDDDLIMVWNDAWLSNKSCDEDNLLDRHYGSPSYLGSGAWLTNYQAGEYEDEATGQICKWNYFVKIVAMPEDAYKVEGVWYNADDVAIGPDIWGQFAIVQEVVNDLCGGQTGLSYVSPDHPSLGGW